MNRRGFLAGILAACAAPAIVRADSLMRIVPMDAPILLGDYDVIVEAGPSYGGPQLDINAIRREVLRIAHEKARFISSINRDYEEAFAEGFASTSGLHIRMPNGYKVRAA